MSTEAPLEVFYRVERGEVRGAMAMRAGLPAPVPRREMRAWRVPCFDWRATDEVRVTLDQKPR